MNAPVDPVSHFQNVPTQKARGKSRSGVPPHPFESLAPDQL